MNRPELKKLTNVPFAPAGLPFFYGWVIVAAASVGMVASIPGQTIGVGVFRDKLEHSLGLSETQVALAYMFGTVTSSFILPFAGTMLDRLGSRVMIVISSMGLGLSLAVMSQLGSLTSLTENTTKLIVMTSVAYLLIRFFGQGCLTLTSRVTVGKWFNHRRGLATGIVSIFVAYTFSSSPAYLNMLVERFEWQNAYLILSVLVGIGMTLIGWVFYRDNPEQCGLVMDGQEIHIDPKDKTSQIAEQVKDFTRAEALKTFPFWIFALATSWQALMMTAVAFLIDAMGADVGLDRKQSYEVFPIIGLVSIFITIYVAWLSDKIRLKWLLLAMLAAQFVTAAGLLEFGSPVSKAFFIAGYAISGSVFSLLLTITWPRYFGRKHLGAISGLTTSMLVFASAIGPVIFSALRGYFDDFRVVLTLAMILPALLFIPSLFVVNPQQQLRKAIANNEKA